MQLLYRTWPLNLDFTENQIVNYLHLLGACDDPTTHLAWNQVQLLSQWMVFFCLSHIKVSAYSTVGREWGWVGETSSEIRGRSLEVYCAPWWSDWFIYMSLHKMVATSISRKHWNLKSQVVSGTAKTLLIQDKLWKAIVDHMSNLASFDTSWDVRDTVKGWDMLRYDNHSSLLGTLSTVTTVSNFLRLLPRVSWAMRDVYYMLIAVLFEEELSMT